jgi:phage tail tape measure protein, TP901 family, core region
VAETIKGINVVIGAETTGLQKALSDVNKQGRNIQSELRQVNKALKFDPSSTTLLAQKQELLGKSIETTKQKLKQLESVQDQVNKQFSSGEISSGQYRAFQREIDITQGKLKNLEGQLKSTSPALQSFGEKANEASKKLSKAGDTASSIGKGLSVGLTLPIAGAAAAAVKIGNDFETSMSQASGALNKPMSQMTSLRDLALKTGQDTQFSATEAGNAITELAKGGLTEAQIKGGSLKATMDLAASSSMDLGTAANTVVQSMGAFGLSASQSSQAVNALAGAAAASSTDVQPLSEGLAQCAAQAHLVGWSIQDTTAVLGEFADAGVVGSDAGTSLKTMLQRLGAPTAAASKTMESLGINVWDSQGHMKNAAGIAQELKTHMSGLSDSQKQAAMSTIFGSDATRAASILMSNGAAGVQKYTKATNDQSSASRLAATQMGETSKSIEQMFGALETAAIQVQGALAPTITAIANKIGDLATAFSNLSPTAQKVILVIAGIAAAIGPVLMVVGGILTVLGTVAGAIGVVTTGAIAATPAIAGLAAVFSVLTGPVGIAIAIMAGVAAIVFIVIKNWTTLKTFFAGIGTFIAGIFTSLGTIIAGIWTSITTTASTIWTSIWTTITTIATSIVTTISSVWSGLVSIVSSIWNGIVTVITTVVSSIVTNVTNYFNMILPGITAIFSGIQSFFLEYGK